MSDDFFKTTGLNGLNIDISEYSSSMLSHIQDDMDERKRLLDVQLQDTADKRKRIQEAVEQTAKNTSETNVRLEKIIDNQNKHIDLLEEQLRASKEQLEVDEEQLSLLRSLFDSSQDSMEIEQEIADLIQQQIDSNHPVKEFLADKGGDIAVAGITAGVPILWSAFKAFLSTKGIILP